MELSRHMEVYLRVAALVYLLGAAIYTDLKYGKVYNKLTIPCMVAGLVLGLVNDGLSGLLSSMAGAGLVLALFLLFAPAAGIGGGDIKLMMAVGALVGLKLAVWALLYSAVVGGAMALLVMARHKALISTTKAMAGNAFLGLLLRAPVQLADGSSRIKFRYSPAIALGTLLAFVLKF
jgi:prepilin peptidase CpaA